MLISAVALSPFAIGAQLVIGIANPVTSAKVVQLIDGYQCKTKAGDRRLAK